MKTFEFSGASDDIFSCNGSDGGFEQCDNATFKEMVYIIRRGDTQEGVRVAGLYTDNATWQIGVSALEETEELKDGDWSFTMKPSYNGYCNLLVVEAPDDAVCGVLYDDKVFYTDEEYFAYVNRDEEDEE